MKLDRYSKQLIEYFKECQYTDILGFGNILGIDDNQEFDDYLTAIVVQFQKENKKNRKGLVKLAKDIAAANKEMGPRPIKVMNGVDSDEQENLFEM